MSCFPRFIQSIIGSTCSFFFFKKKLFLYLVASSTNITQCCLPPMHGFLIDEMSKYILSPGFSLLSSFFFGIFFCLIFSNSLLSSFFFGMFLRGAAQSIIHLACQVNLVVLCCGIHQMMSSMSCYSVEVFFYCFPFTITALTSSGFLITILADNKTELPAFRALSKMIGL